MELIQSKLIAHKEYDPKQGMWIVHFNPRPRGMGKGIFFDQMAGFIDEETATFVVDAINEKTARANNL